ncbi:uncharacterized protein EV422DRAFT_571688 [Fimicolochytrium jonesii]|uniref:uncharacterized protein n=1 Tax=Fimicolochytrium jonesii TaxID=1396493 RepID=UPI0022FF3D13|nr:uncharacterized protein EV422DRAFT_571688 [Fimicolochytrium jonesii]KAI8816509.1 hypothetical protein EV422DRAFT_571688 [Fimicolochytrium jonesii]
MLGNLTEPHRPSGASSAGPSSSTSMGPASTSIIPAEIPQPFLVAVLGRPGAVTTFVLPPTSTTVADLAQLAADDHDLFPPTAAETETQNNDQSSTRSLSRHSSSSSRSSTSRVHPDVLRFYDVRAENLMARDPRLADSEHGPDSATEVEQEDEESHLMQLFASAVRMRPTATLHDALPQFCKRDLDGRVHVLIVQPYEPRPRRAGAAAVQNADGSIEMQTLGGRNGDLEAAEEVRHIDPPPAYRARPLKSITIPPLTKKRKIYLSVGALLIAGIVAGVLLYLKFRPPVPGTVVRVFEENPNTAWTQLLRTGSSANNTVPPTLWALGNVQSMGRLIPSLDGPTVWLDGGWEDTSLYEEYRVVSIAPYPDTDNFERIYATRVVDAISTLSYFTVDGTHRNTDSGDVAPPLMIPAPYPIKPVPLPFPAKIIGVDGVNHRLFLIRETTDSHLFDGRDKYNVLVYDTKEDKLLFTLELYKPDANPEHGNNPQQVVMDASGTRLSLLYSQQFVQYEIPPIVPQTLYRNSSSLIPISAFSNVTIPGFPVVDGLGFAVVDGLGFARHPGNHKDGKVLVRNDTGVFAAEFNTREWRTVVRDYISIGVTTLSINGGELYTASASSPDLHIYSFYGEGLKAKYNTGCEWGVADIAVTEEPGYVYVACIAKGGLRKIKI